MRRIALSLLSITALVAVVSSATGAYFSDTANSTGNIFLPVPWILN